MQNCISIAESPHAPPAAGTAHTTFGCIAWALTNEQNALRALQKKEHAIT